MYSAAAHNPGTLSLFDVSLTESTNLLGNIGDWIPFVMKESQTVRDNGILPLGLRQL